MKLIILENTFSVCRLNVNELFPNWIDRSSFFSLTQTQDELSVVCVQNCVPANIKAEVGWKIIQVAELLDFALTGVMASIASPLAKAEISLFAVSTFNTDYILVKEKNLEQAKECLLRAGFIF